LPKPGSLYFNYKGYFSVILVCADADALFTRVHVGDFGKNSDGSVLRASTLGEKLEKKELHTPFPTSIPLDDSRETLYMPGSCSIIFTKTTLSASTNFHAI
jgi:hypothetical protein